MKIGEVLRLQRPYSDKPEFIDGHPNFFARTTAVGQKKVLIEAGINRPQPVVAKDGKRDPAILIRSSPHKTGSDTTPWHDVFRSDFGHIRYLGDNKKPGMSPDNARGNAMLLLQFALHQSSSAADRQRAAPILCFRSTEVDGRQKGFVQFQGVALIERVERIAQVHPTSKLPFVNYSFDLLVIAMLQEGEVLDWRWVNDRRDASLTLEETLRFAPTSWRTWIRDGQPSLPRIRRAVSKAALVPRSEQVPPSGSREESILNYVYKFFDGKKARFEAVGAFVAARVIGGGGAIYRPGWITQASADHGVDFVGRLDIGSDLARVKLVVLGQAKCQAPTNPTNGKDIARTVARLRRGWIGVYVTTSYFSDATQEEVIEDQYPIVMVDGYRLAKELVVAMAEEGITDIRVLLSRIDEGYDVSLARRSPDEVLLL